MQGHNFFHGKMAHESILWSQKHWDSHCKFCKRWQCHLRKKMQIDFRKTVKKLCSQIFRFFEKNKKFMVSMVSWAVFSNSLKDFSFLDIFKMSKNKNLMVYSKLQKNRIRTFLKWQNVWAYMVSLFQILWKNCDWLCKYFVTNHTLS